MLIYLGIRNRQQLLHIEIPLHVVCSIQTPLNTTPHALSLVGVMLQVECVFVANVNLLIEREIFFLLGG